MKKGILVSVLFLMCFCQVNSTFASELTDDYFDIAVIYFNVKDYPKAMLYLDFVLSLEPDNLKAETLKNKISPPLVDAPQLDTSNPATTDSSPENEQKTYTSDEYTAKGEAFYFKKDYASAITCFYKAIVIDKNNAQAYNNLAMSYWFAKNPDAAIMYFKKAHSINNCYTQPLVNLALLYKHTGDKRSQFFYLQKALKYNPNDYYAYYWLGDYYKTEGNNTKAIKYYKTVVRMNPKFSQVYLSIAMCFFETEQYNYAIQALNQYMEFYPDSDFALYLIARSELELCHYDDAKTHIKRAIELVNRSEYQFVLAKIAYAMNDYQTALNIFQSLPESGDLAEIYNYIGLCYFALKNNDDAIKAYTKAIDLDGLRPIYYYNLAQCYKTLGDKENFEKYSATALKIVPTNYQDFSDLSYIYSDSGNCSDAVCLLNTAIIKYPEKKSLYSAKLKIYEAIGDNLHYNETRTTIDEKFNNK